jgi:hypothetical protein
MAAASVIVLLFSGCLDHGPPNPQVGFNLDFLNDSSQKFWMKIALPGGSYEDQLPLTNPSGEAWGGNFSCGEYDDSSVRFGMSITLRESQTGPNREFKEWGSLHCHRNYTVLVDSNAGLSLHEGDAKHMDAKPLPTTP